MTSISPPSSDPAPSTDRIPSLSATNPINGVVTYSPSTNPDLEPLPKHTKSSALRSQKETNEAAIRSAKAEIRSRLREDWVFPTPETVPLSFFLENENTRWVERDSDSEPPTPTTEKHNDPQWHNPDPFTPVEPGKQRKRPRGNLSPEAEWNEGLQHWTAQRDAWTAAREVSAPSACSPAMSPPRDVTLPKSSLVDEDTEVCGLQAPESSLADDSSTASSLRNSSSTSQGFRQGDSPNTDDTPRTSSLSDTLLDLSKSQPTNTSIPGSKSLLPPPSTFTNSSTVPEAFDQCLPSSSHHSLNTIALDPSTCETSPPNTFPSNRSAQPAPSPTPTSTLIPLAPPLLPADNPVRASITPKTYSALYSKIAIQGLTPTIPINLRDIVNALVMGWKRDGEWPPKSTVEGSNPRGARSRSGLGGWGGAGGINGGRNEGPNGRWTSKGNGVYSWGGNSALTGAARGGGHTGRRVVRRSVEKAKKALGMGVQGGEIADEGVEGIVEGESIVMDDG